MATVDADRPCGAGSPVFEMRHDLDGEATLSETVIEAVASAEGVDPTDRDLGLYDAVDLEALDALFERRPADSHWQFEFAVGEYLVLVDGDGVITVCEG